MVELSKRYGFDNSTIVLNCYKGGETIDNLSQLFKLLSDHSRLMILLALESEPLSVSKLIEMTGLSQPLVSFHLKVLREANLVLTQRHGTFVYNAVCDQSLIPLIRQFEKYQPDVAETPNTLPFNCPPWHNPETQ